MELLNISGRLVTVALSPEDAFALALACSDSSLKAMGSDYPLEAHITASGATAAAWARVIEAYAALFEAAALAAASHSYLRGRDALEEVTTAAMRAGQLLEPLT